MSRPWPLAVSWQMCDLPKSNIDSKSTVFCLYEFLVVGKILQYFVPYLSFRNVLKMCNQNLYRVYKQSFELNIYLKTFTLQARIVLRILRNLLSKMLHHQYFTAGNRTVSESIGLRTANKIRKLKFQVKSLSSNLFRVASLTL